MHRLGSDMLDDEGVVMALPEWLEPMAATLTKDRFANDDWVFERKLDGIRLLAFKDGVGVRLLTRNRLSHNHHYPDVVNAIAALPVTNAILDGEAMGVWREHDEVGLHVFDVLWLDGEDLTGLVLDDRRMRLEGIKFQPPLYLVERLYESAPWDRACAEGWEGVIAKRRDSVYEHRRSPYWLKMKCEASQELVVGGFTEPKGSRVGLGALLVGYYDGDDFVYAGRVGTGFDDKLLTDLRIRFDALLQPKPPFTVATDLPREGLWVKPEVVVQVAFMEWTSNGKMRHPRLLGIRPDKAAREVVRESS